VSIAGWVYKANAVHKNGNILAKTSEQYRIRRLIVRFKMLGRLKIAVSIIAGSKAAPNGCVKRGCSYSRSSVKSCAVVHTVMSAA
jgi:hypothetical protein